MLNKTLNNDEAENPTTSPTASELVDSRGLLGRVPAEMDLSRGRRVGKRVEFGFRAWGPARRGLISLVDAMTSIFAHR